MPKRFDKLVQAANAAYPETMRRQLWPLCCGASILSGFKLVYDKTEDEITALIESTINDYIPDLQVYTGETICPKLTYLTLNYSQMQSAKIMNAVKRAGFVLFATARPRGSDQGFFVRDESKTFKLVGETAVAEKASA